MTDRKLLEQALEALELPCDRWNCTQSKIVNRATIALRKRLAQQEPRNQCGETCERAKLCAVCLAEMGEQPEQEPVAWLSTDCIGERYLWFSKPLDNDTAQPLYTAPPKREWQGLTDEEISAIEKSIPSETDLWVAKCVFAREIEAKLKEKND